jgi:glycosyltransferase involved in cell wall biosynthesis
MTDYHLEEHGRGRGLARATVAVSLYNYRRFIVEALDSVASQTLKPISLLVVDDASRDGSADRASCWMRKHGSRFVRATLVRRGFNAGLAAARNLALKLAESPLLFILDADNSLYPRCLERLEEALEADPRAAMAYCILEAFGEECRLMGTPLWSRDRLAGGNYIDAMSLLRTKALRRLGGYASMHVPGYEDYDLWCRFVENGFYGVHVPEILARYRVHSASMLSTDTHPKKQMQHLVAEMLEKHPWLKISLEGDLAAERLHRIYDY